MFLCVCELINIDIFIQFDTVLRLQLQTVCEPRPTISPGPETESAPTPATREGTTRRRPPMR